MKLIDTLILGIVEGITEFLPISSTGHLIVVGHWLGIEQSKSKTAFDIIIQLAAILAVVANYRDKFTPAYAELWLKVLLAFLPIGAVGLLLGDWIEELFSVKIVALMFIVGGIVFLVLEYFYRPDKARVTQVENTSWRQTIWIGVAQVFALVPGTSRAGSTIVGALLVGLDRKASAEFSFLLALPVMCATTGYTLLKHYQEFSGSNLITLAVGFVVSFVVAYLTMRWFIRFLAQFTFVAFGVYRIVFGLLLLVLFV